jgi:hypothetical protein
MGGAPFTFLDKAMVDTNWSELLIGIALDLPAVMLYVLLLVVGIWRMNRGEPGALIAAAAVIWIGLRILTKVYYTVLWPLWIDSMSENINLFIRVSSFVINLAYCIPLLCLIIGLFPRQNTTPQNIPLKTQP